VHIITDHSLLKGKTYYH